MSASNARELNVNLDIDADRDAVWQAVSSAECLGQWFAPEARMEGQVGGKVSWIWDELAWHQTVVEVKKGELFRTRYDSAVDDGAGGKRPLFIDFRLEGKGGKTRLNLVHSGFGPEAEFDQEFDGISHGWSFELQHLKAYVERHFGKTRRLAWSRQVLPESMTQEEAWEVLCGANGLQNTSGAPRAGGDFALERNGLRGQVLVGDALGFNGIAKSHNDAIVRFGIETCTEQVQAWLWLMAYDDKTEVRAVQADWDAMLEGLFATTSSGHQS